MKKILFTLCVFGLISACSSTPVSEDLTTEKTIDGVISLDSTLEEESSEAVIADETEDFSEALIKFAREKQSEADEAVAQYKKQKSEEIEELVSQYKEEQTKLADEQIEAFKAQKSSEVELAIDTFKKEKSTLSE